MHCHLQVGLTYLGYRFTVYLAYHSLLKLGWPVAADVSHLNFWSHLGSKTSRGRRHPRSIYAGSAAGDRGPVFGMRDVGAVFSLLIIPCGLHHFKSKMANNDKIHPVIFMHKKVPWIFRVTEEVPWWNWSMEASSLDVAELAPVGPGLWRHKVLRDSNSDCDWCSCMTHVWNWLVERLSGWLVGSLVGLSSFKWPKELLLATGMQFSLQAPKDSLTKKITCTRITVNCRQMYSKHCIFKSCTVPGINISSPKTLSKTIFLFPKWDMLVFWNFTFQNLFRS